MQTPSPKGSKRNGIRLTALLLALLAMGFYAGFFIRMSHNG